MLASAGAARQLSAIEAPVCTALSLFGKSLAFYLRATQIPLSAPERGEYVADSTPTLNSCAMPVTQLPGQSLNCLVRLLTRTLQTSGNNSPLRRPPHPITSHHHQLTAIQPIASIPAALPQRCTISDHQTRRRLRLVPPALHWPLTPAHAEHRPLCDSR